MGENRFFLLALALQAEAAELARAADDARRAAEAARLAAEANAAEAARLAASAREAEIARRLIRATLRFLNATPDDVCQHRARADLDRDARVDSASHADAKIRIGDHAGDLIMQYVFGFELPVLPANTMVCDATLELDLRSDPAAGELTTHNVDLWVVGIGASITPLMRWHLGPAGVPPGGVQSGATFVEGSVFTRLTPLGIVRSRDTARVALRDAIGAFYEALTVEKLTYTGGSRVYMRLNCDRPPNPAPASSGYVVSGSGAIFPQKPPRLVLFVG